MEPLTWSAHEFEEKTRHPDWIWYAGLVFALSAALAFFYGNIFFGILLVVSGALIVMFALRKPRVITITLSETEFTLDDTIIDLTRITQFWIDETQKPDKLLVLVRGSFVPMLAIPMEGITPDVLRSALKARNIPEVAMSESFGARISERLGF